MKANGWGCDCIAQVHLYSSSIFPSILHAVLYWMDVRLRAPLKYRWPTLDIAPQHILCSHRWSTIDAVAPPPKCCMLCLLHEHKRQAALWKDEDVWQVVGNDNVIKKNNMKLQTTVATNSRAPSEYSTWFSVAVWKKQTNERVNKTR